MRHVDSDVRLAWALGEDAKKSHQPGVRHTDGISHFIKCLYQRCKFRPVGEQIVDHRRIG